MNIETAKILSRFIDNHIDHEMFKDWVYSNPDLENDLGEELYLDLISLNFKDNSIRIEVEKLFNQKIDYATIHRTEILELIVQIESKEINLLNGIRKLYDWAEKGYTFFLSSTTIGNFGEQGKSIILLINESMSNEEQWKKVTKDDSHFVNDLASFREKINKGNIVITGGMKIHKYFGKQFEFIEKYST